MQTIEYRTHDKTGWGDGPWQSEPDKKQWLDQQTGLPCLIVRGPVGALCGYVGVPKGHWAHGNDYDDINVDDDVHGGLTFAGGCTHGPENIGICHKVDHGEPDDAWWLGFDCSHFLDFNPLLECQFGDQDREYRTLAYVEQECMKLARQLKEVA